MTMEPGTDDDVRGLLRQLARPATPFGPGVVQGIRRKAHRQRQARRVATLTLASALLLGVGSVANTGQWLSSAPPAGRDLLDWPTHGSGPYVLAAHLGADGHTSPSVLSRLVAEAWNRDGGESGHHRVRVLFSDEVIGSGNQIVVVAQGLTRAGRAEMAVFTGYLPGALPPGVNGSGLQLIGDAAVPVPKPQTLLIALNGLSRGPGASGAWTHDQSALVALTSSSAPASEIRVSPAGPGPTRSLTTEPSLGYSVMTLGASAVPVGSSDSAISVGPVGTTNGATPQRLDPESAVGAGGPGPTAVIYAVR